MSQVVIALLFAAGILAVIGIVGLILFLFNKKAFFTALSFFVKDAGKAEDGDMKLDLVKEPEKKVQKSLMLIKIQIKMVQNYQIKLSNNVVFQKLNHMIF